MKVLCASVFKDGTGYANEAIELDLAAEQAGLDVVCRSIALSPRHEEAAQAIAHLETKDLQGLDAVIQYCLPHTFEYRGGVKNIGMFTWETTHFRRSSWASSCNLMDEIWVPSRQAKAACVNSGVNVPVRLIPQACDITKFARPLPPLSHPMLSGKTVFYTIGEHVRRKNIVGLLRAYYATFSSRDDVALLIKTSVPGMNDQQALNYVRGTCEDVRRSMHLYPDPRSYPPVLVITDYLSEEAIHRIHQAGHCFVLPSHGESWCIPAHDAMLCGNPVIASRWGSFPDLMAQHASWDGESQTFECPDEVLGGHLVSGHLTPCFSPDGGFPDLYTGDERWFEPDLDHLGVLMQSVHLTRRAEPLYWADKRRDAQARAEEFSREVVGQMIRKALEE